MRIETQNRTNSTKINILSVLVFHNQGFQCFLDRPSSYYNSMPKGAWFDGNNLRPLRECQCLSSRSKSRNVPSIPCLLLQRNPSAILSTIVAYWINTIYLRVFLPIFVDVGEIRSTHISPKFVKGIPLTFNSFCSITGITNVVRILTTSTEGKKDIIRAFLRKSMLIGRIIFSKHSFSLFHFFLPLQPTRFASRSAIGAAKLIMV